MSLLTLFVFFKKKDLKLAAEIGKSLLENNMALKTNYDHLLSSCSPYPTPSNSSSSLIKLETTTVAEEDQENDLKYVPSTTREALVEMLEKKNEDLSRQLETVLSKQEKLDRSHTKKARQLESQVELLQSSLDHATTKIQEMETMKRKTLTKDGSIVLDKARNELQQQEQQQEQGSQEEEKEEGDTYAILTVNSNTAVCAGSCAQLKLKMEQLKIENDHVNQAKAQIEKNLFETLHDMRLLKQKFEDLQFTTYDHEQLQKAFDAQQLHINELKNSLEEHRHALTKLRERGVYLSAEDDDDEEQEEEESRRADRMRNNLLTELENAWLKHQNPEAASYSSSSGSSSSLPSPSLYSQDDCSTTSSILFQPFQVIYNQLPNVDTALESILVKAGVVEKDALDDALSLIGRLENEYDHEKFLLEKRHLCYKDDYQRLDSPQKDTSNAYGNFDYFEKSFTASTLPSLSSSLPSLSDVQTAPTPSTGLVGFAQNIIKAMIYMTWRWFRFVLVMTIAIFMSLKEGPDALLL